MHAILSLSGSISKRLSSLAITTMSVDRSMRMYPRYLGRSLTAKRKLRLVLPIRAYTSSFHPSIRSFVRTYCTIFDDLLLQRQHRQDPLRLHPSRSRILQLLPSDLRLAIKCFLLNPLRHRPRSLLPTNSRRRSKTQIS